MSWELRRQAWSGSPQAFRNLLTLLLKGHAVQSSCNRVAHIDSVHQWNMVSASPSGTLTVETFILIVPFGAAMPVMIVATEVPT